ncbi:MAG: glycosyltransferase, partial [Nitrospira sp.]|nr:glycosyltransferase [Nitrospira sp.]
MVNTIKTEELLKAVKGRYFPTSEFVGPYEQNGFAHSIFEEQWLWQYRDLIRGNVLDMSTPAYWHNYIYELPSVEKVLISDLCQDEVSKLGYSSRVDVIGNFSSSNPPLPPSSVDTILCNSILEHCEDPFMMVINLGQIIRPGGVIFLMAPYAYIDGHMEADYWRFGRDGYLLLARRAGLEVIETGHYGDMGKYYLQEYGFDASATREHRGIPQCNWMICRRPETPDDSVKRIKSTQEIKIFADKQYKTPGKPVLPLLMPLWGKGYESPEDPDCERFDHYLERGANLFRLTSLQEADIAILPNEWSPDDQNVLRLSQEASRHNKKVVVFYNNDSDRDIDIPDSIIFRTSFYRSRRKPNEFAVPAWSVDFLERYFNGKLNIREKTEKPLISFCGLLDSRNIRSKAVSVMQKSDKLKTNFIIRPQFWGGALNRKMEASRVREEYARNIYEGDYVLCARGAGNFSYRLYETLSMGRIPVFINTDCVLPYDFIIDWKKYCVWVEENEIDSIAEIVSDFHSSISPEKFIELQHECRKLWDDWISPGGFFTNFYRHLEDVPRITTLEKGDMGGFERSKNGKPRCLFINTYYNGFLSSIYKKSQELLTATFNEQKARLQGQFFGDSDFYSEGLKKAGWEADDLIVNCTPLQEAWAREENFKGHSLNIAVEQIRGSKPEVVYIQDLSLCTREFLSAIRPYTDLIVGQIASPVPPHADIHGFDIIFSSFPHFVERFRKEGITSYYLPLAFDPRVLQKEEVNESKRNYPVTFVGGISAVHSSGTRLLEELVKNTPIEFWGYGAETLSVDSPIRQRHHGEVWGLEMFSILSQSQITVNRHIDVAENNANNMRLFEATGCGALLITDYKDNLSQLFDIGKEIVAYRSPEECAALIKYYLANPEEAGKIAEAGQRRTISEHTYDKRMEKIGEILKRHLRYRKDKNIYPAPELSKISYGHTPIRQSDISGELTSAWKNTDIPKRQRALVQQELIAMYKGQMPLPYRVLAETMKSIITPGSSILEIGCSSGYYYEVLEYLLNREIDYTGVDYSEAFIDMAKDYYPRARFFVSDGANLFFEDRQFHTVISSCILLHTPNFQEHIFETARVAKKYVVAHRTPVCRNRQTQYLKKYAYGVETVELVFNESEILQAFSVNR